MESNVEEEKSTLATVQDEVFAAQRMVMKTDAMPEGEA